MKLKKMRTILSINYNSKLAITKIFGGAIKIIARCI